MAADTICWGHLSQVDRQHAQYARSSRLAIRAPRSRIYATNHAVGTLERTGPRRGLSGYCQLPPDPRVLRPSVRLKGGVLRRQVLTGFRVDADGVGRADDHALALSEEPVTLRAGFLSHNRPGRTRRNGLRRTLPHAGPAGDATVDDSHGHRALRILKPLNGNMHIALVILPAA